MRHLLLLITLTLSQTLNAEEIKSAREAKSLMNKVYRDFALLQPYLADEELFTDPAKHDQILSLINGLSSSFHTADKFSGDFKNDPALEVTLSIAKDFLQDANRRFKEDKKSYARWKLQSAGQLCIACHTRHEVPSDFSPAQQTVESLSPFSRGEFYLATRQFAYAQKIFQGIARTTDNPDERMEALRKVLLILIRVSPDPHKALKDISEVKSTVKLTNFELSEINSWESGLSRWINEKTPRVENLQSAESLIKEGINPPSLIDGESGVVELLRATRMLHSLLEKNQKTDRAHALYLLGLAYRNIPLFSSFELASLFFELCIREFPGTNDAKKSYRNIYELRIQDFTGIHGGKIPDEIKLELEELEMLAYKKMSTRNLFKI